MGTGCADKAVEVIHILMVAAHWTFNQGHTVLLAARHAYGNRAISVDSHSNSNRPCDTTGTLLLSLLLWKLGCFCHKQLVTSHKD